MSERRAKRERKAQVAEAPVQKKNPKRVIANVVIVLVVAAIAALGGWAAYDKIKAELPASTDAETQVTSTTVAQLAEAEGITAEELLEKCGMTESGLTGESTQEEFFALLTVENYAGYMGKTADELKAENGIEDVANDTLWQEAQMQIPMSKVAEQYGVSFEEFAEQNGLPEAITADMTQGQAMAIMQATQATTEE